MLNAAGRTSDGRPLLMLGLTGENITRLMAGEPIYLEAKAPTYGLPAMQVMICGAKTELDLIDGLRSSGLVPPCCPDHNHHCEPPSELCCGQCTEGVHPDHPRGVLCVLDPKSPFRAGTRR